MSKKAFVEFRQVTKVFPLSKRLFGKPKEVVRAVDKATFTLEQGTTLGLVGESGSGKTTLARILLRLERPTEGLILYRGEDISTMSTEGVREFRREVSAVFQNPFSSLSPRMRVWEIVGEPLIVNNLARGDRLRERVIELLEMVGLRRDDLDRFPHQFSGGQRQRVAIARALSSGARLIVLDEPVSSLDVSVRAQILNLLRNLKEEFNLTYVFVSHDLNLVYYMSEQVVVMYLGKIVEAGNIGKVFASPAHPYTQALLSAAPVPDPDRKWVGEIIKGDPVDASADMKGCAFAPRCKYISDGCDGHEAVLTLVELDHFSTCRLGATLLSDANDEA